MQIILIRHGEPDYAPCDARKFCGHGRELAPLTAAGVTQAEQAAQSPLLEGSEIIVASPYTRALQTAAILSRVTGIPLTVEMDLREWEPDRTYQYRTREERHAIWEDFVQRKGIYPPGEVKDWESVSHMVTRIRPVIDSYYQKGYHKIIVAAHGGIIRRFVGKADISYCGIYPIEYSGAFEYFQWVD